MKTDRKTIVVKIVGRCAFQILLLLTLTTFSTACSFDTQFDEDQLTPLTPINETPVTILVSTPTSTDTWAALLQKRPYPYATPLPENTPTILDGIYVKVEPKEGTPVPCRRCPDYSPEGGGWKLNLDSGVYHIYHEATRWRSLGSFTISGERLYLFNDPTCFQEIGTYEWQRVEGKLKLEVIEDGCHVDRRARGFTNMEWQSCQPPSTEAAITDHWSKPVGCEKE